MAGMCRAEGRTVQGYREWRENQGMGDAQGMGPGNGLCVSCWTLMMDTESAAVDRVWTGCRRSVEGVEAYGASCSPASRPNLAAQSHILVLRTQTLFIILNGWHALKLKSRLWRGTEARRNCRRL